jgi:asparagine synthase (glutamine-hydrolysing)
MPKFSIKIIFFIVCGIAGIKFFNKIASNRDETNIFQALERQKHRGPDNTNVKSQGNTIFGHNRLSIIDTNDRSNQPFIDETQRYCLVFNGEIYNFHELKNELLAKNYQFKTASDTEVLFFLLIEYKVAALEKLRGCFAFSFYDKQEDFMLLARDRMGINPLLYSFDENQFVFGSELFVFEDLIPNKTISDEALNFYFQYTYIPAPHTIFEEVKKLEPGHFIEINKDKINIQSFWDPKADSQYTDSYENAKVELKKKVEFAVISQLEADVPIGTFLSGGVDSSIVSAIASTQKNDLHTFSVSFGDQQAYDESQYALKVAKHIESKHHVIRLTEKDFKENFQSILDSFDEPFADSSAIAMWFLAKETSKHLKVALSGDGADELFAGYNKHLAFQKSKEISALKKSSLRAAEKVLTPLLLKTKPKKIHKLSKFNLLNELAWPENYWFLASNIGEEAKNLLLKNSFKTKKCYQTEGASLSDFLWMDQKFILPNDMLKKVDLMSMRHSLEVRTPFMDKDLVKFANSLPQKWKLNGSTAKFILKETFKDLIPGEIFSRSKQGFEVPLNAWIKNSWSELIPEIWFEENYIQEQGIFNYSAIRSMKKHFFSNIGTSNQELWAYFVFQNWFQKFKKNA